MIYGKTTKDTAKGLYRVRRRFPITLSYFAYEDGAPVLDSLLPKNIVDNNGDVIVSAEDILGNKISLSPTMPITAAEVVRDILYAIMYDESSERSLFFEDPLNLTDVPLIPIMITGLSLLDTVTDILARTYGHDERKLETFLSFFSNEMTRNEYNLFRFNQVFEIDADREIFVLSSRGTPREYRYDLGLVMSRIVIK